METNKFWEREAEKHIIPNTGEEFPEGWNVLEFLSKLFPENESLIEVGCGTGRLSTAFNSTVYTGLDINENVLKEAKLKNSEYKYIKSEILPNSKHKLVYTVLLHISDNDIELFIENMCSSTENTIVVAEIMGRDWRRAGLPPVFNREVNEYISLFNKHNFSLESDYKRPYKRYTGWSKKDTRLHILKFKNDSIK